MHSLRKSLQQCLAAELCAAFFASAPAQGTTEAVPSKFPSIMVPATGGMIAGTGAVSTTTVGYPCAIVA